jgi:Zn-dependent M28 family amino/carboxypeptidase
VPYSVAIFHNLLAEQEGATCPERLFIVGAHYDSAPGTPGADDNTTGTAAMLEIAHALADVQLPVTVRFVGFTLEEQGMIGGQHMAAGLKAQNAEVVGMMSLDMIGYTTSEMAYLVTLENTASVRLTDSPVSGRSGGAVPIGAAVAVDSGVGPVVDVVVVAVGVADSGPLQASGSPSLSPSYVR